MVQFLFILFIYQVKSNHLNQFSPLNSIVLTAKHENTVQINLFENAVILDLVTYGSVANDRNIAALGEALANFETMPGCPRKINLISPRFKDDSPYFKRCITIARTKKIYQLLFFYVFLF